MGPVPKGSFPDADRDRSKQRGSTFRGDITLQPDDALTDHVRQNELKDNFKIIFIIKN